MPSRTKALLTLLVAPPILTEIASGNTPAHAFLNPRVVLFLILAYSFPLLIIRECSLRLRLSAAGVFLLGLAYGIVNEGLLAQTLLRNEHVPIDTFDHYIYLAGFNFSWTCVIVPWHAFFAVLFPLALLAFWFPACAQTLWLSTRAFKMLAAIFVALMAFFSLVRTPHLQMLVCFLCIAALSCTAFFFRDPSPPSRQPPVRRAVPFLFGLFAYPFFVLGSIALAAKHAPAPVFFLFVVVVLLGVALIARRGEFLLQPVAAYLALGGYVSVSFFHFLAGIAHHSPEGIATGGVLVVSFLYLALRRRHVPELRSS